MTGKVLENNPAGFLIMILPLAMGIVIIYKAWPFILLIVALGIGLKLWTDYQWRQWSAEVNPYFNELIKENQGCLTAMDLSLKTNLAGAAAKRFLEKKAEEYGAFQRTQDKGVVYYFLTASALGSIFDDSEPEIETEAEISVLPSASAPPVILSEFKPEEASPPPTVAAPSAIAKLAELKEARQKQQTEIPIPEESQPVTENAEIPVVESLLEVLQQEQPLSEESLVTEETPLTEEAVTPPETSSKRSLIQADLAKRLDLNPSTLARRRADPDFPEWSQSRDPEGIAWKYNSKTKMFVSVEIEE